MKFSLMHTMGHRELADDFDQKHHSIWVDPPWHECATSEHYASVYRDSIEEMVFAANKGFDGLALNEHHQNAFGGLPNPNLLAAILAYRTRDLDVALVQLGSTLPTTAPPNRIAEEYAMIDLLSGGRLVAGMPVGTPMDVTMCYGVPPLDHRARYVEAHDLILKAWTAKEPFIWNGKYFQLPCVNVWPQPMQKPRPPVWVPGTASPSTWDFCAVNDHLYMVLTAFSGQLGIQDCIRLLDGYWERVDARGRDRNPFRAGIAVIPVVGESMAQIERDYAKHIHYFFQGTTGIAPEHLNPPGEVDYKSLAAIFRQIGRMDSSGGALAPRRFEGFTFKDYVDKNIVLAGTPESVAQQLEELTKRMNTGHLMVCMSFGSMPKELAKENLGAFAEGVIPRLRHLFEGEGWENHWWPERLRGPRRDVAKRETVRQGVQG